MTGPRRIDTDFLALPRHSLADAALTAATQAGASYADLRIHAITTETVALRDGALLVILIVLLFVVSVRGTIITALAIPLSLLTAVLALSALGADASRARPHAAASKDNRRRR